MRTQRGFTLIELMIVVIVIAVLAAIAIPNYLEQSRKGRRADAVRAMGEYQLAIERWRAENPCYGQSGATGCPTFTASGTYPTTPTSEFYTVPSGGITTSETAYSITFSPSGKQAGDRCGSLVGNNSDKQKPRWSGDADCNQ
jgi:type IV pilus assembly protein PilE